MRMRCKDRTVILHRTPAKKEKNERRGRHMALFCEKNQENYFIYRELVEKHTRKMRNISKEHLPFNVKL